MEMNKARNLIEHEEEIFSRPPRVWFQSKADLKRKSGKNLERSCENSLSCTAVHSTCLMFLCNCC